MYIYYFKFVTINWFNNIWTIVLIRLSTIEVNDKVDITFSDADVLVFDDEGNRVYA
nr:hypothetical protein [Mycoplasmopsis bovis]